jgi:hypothetical protein
MTSCRLLAWIARSFSWETISPTSCCAHAPCGTHRGGGHNLLRSTVGISAQGTETELGQDKGKLMPLIVICEHPSPIAKVFLVGL